VIHTSNAFTGSGLGWLIAIGFFVFLLGLSLVLEIAGYLRDRR